MVKKMVRGMTLTLSHVIIGVIFVLVFISVSADKEIEENQIDISEGDYEDINNTVNSPLVDALESYYGEWVIVEDFGYHGIHRMTEIEVFEVGKYILFQRDIFQYEDSIEVPYPCVVIEMTSSGTMEQLDKIEYPHQLGFSDQYAQYAKVYIKESGSYRGDTIVSFYVLNENEIILQGDVQRYYRAVRGI